MKIVFFSYGEQAGGLQREEQKKRWRKRKKNLSEAKDKILIES